MAHSEQNQFIRSVRERFPGHFKGVRVLEIGSYNVNGTVRDLFTDCDYIGIDVGSGPGVDIVWPDGAANWLVAKLPAAFDTVISAECLEHDPHWQATLQAAVGALKPGGLLCLTCAGRGRQEHGTRRTSPQDVAPGFPWPDYYRGLDEADLASALRLPDFWEYSFASCEWPSDTYFFGVKA